MDNAVALVQSYLRINGYFTVAEYPVVEATRAGRVQMATDLDILGFRFPGAGRLVISPDRQSLTSSQHQDFSPDPALGIPVHQADMLIGEVKEGKAELNQATKNPGVLEAVLKRFGCCSHACSEQVVRELLREGRAKVPSGHQVRLVAFGASHSSRRTDHYQVISLGHVVRFLRRFVKEHWSVLKHTKSKDPALGMLLTLEKASRSS